MGQGGNVIAMGAIAGAAVLALGWAAVARPPVARRTRPCRAACRPARRIAHLGQRRGAGRGARPARRGVRPRRRAGRGGRPPARQSPWADRPSDARAVAGGDRRRCRRGRNRRPARHGRAARRRAAGGVRCSAGRADRGNAGGARHAHGRGSADGRAGRPRAARDLVRRRADPPMRHAPSSTRSAMRWVARSSTASARSCRRSGSAARAFRTTARRRRRC